MTNAPEEDYDDCPVCERQTRYNGDQCTECGRLWGIDYSREDIAERLLHEKAEQIARDVTARYRVTLPQQMMLEQVAIAAALAGMEAAR